MADAAASIDIFSRSSENGGEKNAATARRRRRGTHVHDVHRRGDDADAFSLCGGVLFALAARAPAPGGGAAPTAP